MKKRLNKIKAIYQERIRPFFGKIKLVFVKLLKKVEPFYTNKFIPFKDKVKHALTHNFILNITATHLVLFSFLRLKLTNKRRESMIGYMFIMVWIIGFLIFALYPVFYTLYLSFFRVTMDGRDINTVFVGLGNFQAALLRRGDFPELLVNYALEMILNVPVTIVFALVIAMLINQNIKGRGVWRTIFFLPVIIASGPVIRELMDQGATTLPSIAEYNFIDLVINNIGELFANPIQALFDQILLVLWFSGIQILILLAGLQKIDKSVYEAAMIDGAGPWESFWKITLPSIMPLINVTIIYTVVAMSVFSENPIIIHIRERMFSFSHESIAFGYGYGSAIAWIYFVVMVVIILVFIAATSLRRRVK